ncbi:unnamed protein product [Strongylus vulgaris]|uniref:G-protein coupled receptors family 1 profile domain-containing protein n=1 Tax=Strongylus vulgaris TaxID=40348 RepID=A0A3P7IX25_STRVU|nr:unnamed protein product [Strongylus vulgaris]
MKFLIATGISAVVTYIFINVSMFTQEWVTVSFMLLKASAGIFPWGCVSKNTCGIFWDNADGWAISTFLALLFAWILQFFVVLAAILALVVPRWRFHLSRGFMGKQSAVVILLLYVLIAYGATYDRNTGFIRDAGVDIYVRCAFSTSSSLFNNILDFSLALLTGSA